MRSAKHLNVCLLYATVVCSLLLFRAPLGATNCANAIPVTAFPVIGQSLVCGTTNDLSTATVPEECNSFQNNYKEGKEALYSFTPSSSGTYFISYSGKYHTAVFVYDGCPENGGSCVGGLGSNAPYKTLAVSLTAGVTYYIWFDIWTVTGESACPGTFSLTSSLPNDNCPGAIAFPPFLLGVTTVTIATSGATGTADPVCVGTEDDDVWYSFTTPAGVTSLAYSNSNVVWGNGNFVLQIFQGTCGNLTSIGCYNPENGVITGLSGNTTYYLRAYTHADAPGPNVNSTFDLFLSLPSLPPNDNCPGAIAFPAIPANGDCSEQLVNTADATGTADATCTGTEDDDVWYTFTTLPGLTFVNYRTTNVSGTADRVFQLFSGDCNQLTSIGCYDLETGTMAGLSPNTTYYLRVYTKSSNSPSSFYLCLSAPLPANDGCSTAIAFPDIQTTCSDIPVNTVGATGSGGAACLGEADDDLWYTFTTPFGYTFVNYKMTNISGSADRVLEVFSGDCGSLTSIGCYDPETGLITGLSPSTTYYLRVYTKDSGAFSSFSLCLQILSPANDFCSGAIAFPALSTDGSCATVPVFTQNATGGLDAACAGWEDDDVWYTFTTPPGTTSVLFSTVHIAGNDAWVLQLYGGTCNNFLSSECFVISEAESGVFSGLTGNTTYYLRAFSYGISPVFSTFEICLRASPANDYCQGAIPFPPIPTDYSCASVTASTVNATSSGGSPNCVGSPADDVWFSFTTPPNVSKLFYSNTNISGSANRMLQLYQGTCAGLVSLGCYDAESGAFSGLTGNTTYYLKALTSDADGFSIFNICLHILVPNDDCAGAIPFPAIPADGNCASVSGNTENAYGASAATCGGVPDDDMWFSFFVPAGVTTLDYDLTPVSGSGDLVIQLFRGSCTLSAGCFDQESGTFFGLLGNTTYYLQVFTKGGGVPAVFDLCLHSAPAIPNDNCSGAIPITGLSADGSCVMTTISTMGATGSASTVCVGEEDDDVWYSFTTPPGYTAVYYAMTNLSGSANRVLQVYASCANLSTSLGCYDAESGVITGLSGNTTYYLRAYTYETGMVSTFDLCLRVVPHPANDNCTGAFSFPEFPADGSCAEVTVTTSGATGATSATCTGAEDDDVWYSFTTPAGTNAILYDFTDISGNNSYALQVFQGTCSGLVSIGCYTPVTGGYISGLSGNTTYHLRVYTQPSGVSSTFKLCLRLMPPSPANDECPGATAFPDIPADGSESSVTFTTFGATGTPDNTCQGAEDDDVWLTFTVPPGSTRLLFNYTHIAGYSESYFQLFSGDCGNLTPAGCHYELSYGHIDGLTGGSTYYIRVYTRLSNVAGTFKLTLKTVAANDECVNAIPFPDFPSDGGCAEVIISESNASPNSIVSSAGCIVTQAKDLWYSFSVPPGVSYLHYRINREIFADYQQFHLYRGDCSALTSIGCFSASEGALTGLSSGVVYYIRAFEYDWGYPYSEFSICLTLPLANDECPGAIAFPSIPADGSCATVAVNTATATGTADATCNGTEDDDLWYTFTTPPGVTTLFYSYANLVTSNNNIYFQLFSGSNCSALTSVGCFQDNNITLGGLSENTTYRLRVYTSSGGNATFDMCLRGPVINDACAGAIAFSDLSADGSCATVTASTSFATGTDDPTCTGNENDDVWYTFTTPSGLSVISYEMQTISGTSDRQLQLFSGACGNLTPIGCYDPESGIFTGLSSNTTYYLRAYTWSGTASSTFSICLRVQLINDICEQASAFPAIPLDGTCAQVTASTTYATGTADPACTGGEEDDVWFTFTTPPGISVIAYENVTISGSTNRVLQVFSGTCGNLTSIGCYDPENGAITGLSGNTTYYLRAYTSSTSDRAVFNICLRIPASNDECPNAIAFPAIPTDGSCAVLNISTKFATGSSDPTTCTGALDDDIWYTFTTPPGVNRLVYQGSGELSGVAFQIFSGNCNSLVSVGCFTSSHGIITGLTGNTTYYLRAYTSSAGISRTGDFCLRLLLTNDNCSGAIAFPALALDGSCSSVSVSATGATGSPDPTCAGVEDDDVWYTFTTPPGVTVLWFELINSAGEYKVMEVFSGNSCLNRVSIGCYDPVVSPNGHITGLTGNTTYYMRVYSLASSTSVPAFEVCLRVPPPNDLCTNAIAFPTLPSDGSCAEMNVSARYASGSAPTACIENGKDVWYTFTTPPGIEAVHYQATGIDGYDLTMEVLSGNCGNLTSIGCYNSNETSGTLTGLAGGTTYYLRIYTASFFTGNYFSLCLRSTPANDFCPYAIAFPAIPADGSCATVTAHTGTALDTEGLDCDNWISEEADVWFTFTTPPNVTRLRYETDVISGNVYEEFQILRGSCGNLVPMACYFGGRGVITGLTGNTTYYLRAFTTSTPDTAAFSICLKLPLSNDDCANAILIDGCTNSVTGNFYGVTADTHSSCFVNVTPDTKGVWYRLTGDGLPLMLHTCLDSEAKAGIIVYSGSCGSEVCVTGNQGACSSGSQVSWITTAGQDYYVLVYAVGAIDYDDTFTLSIVGGVQCPSVISQTTVSIDTINTGVTFSWPVIAGIAHYDYVLSASGDCSAGPVQTTTGNSVSFSGLEPDTQYTFCLSASCSCVETGFSSLSFTTPSLPLPNDYCVTAAPIACGTTVTGSTAGAFADGSPGACAGQAGLSPGNGVWYSLPGDGSLITLDLCASAYDTRVHVYSGGCDNNLVCIAGNDDACGAQSKVSFLSSPGEDYFVLVSGTNGGTGDFNLTISCICEEPIGTPWSTIGVGGAPGTAINNYCGRTIDVTSEGTSASASSDLRFFVFQNACDSISLTAKVSQLPEGVFAGIVFRESTDPGSRMLAIKRKKSKYLHFEIRHTANGMKSTQQFFTPGHTWMRLTRKGNQITGYSSMDGVYWEQHFHTTFVLPDCVEAGLFVESTQANAPAAASFSNVSLTPATLTDIPLPPPGNTPSEFTVYPNPSESELNVQVDRALIGSSVTFTIHNQLGQVMALREIDEMQQRTETFDVQHLPAGVYIMTLRLEGGEVVTKKFVVGRR